jgi:hypothetical protein
VRRAVGNGHRVEGFTIGRHIAQRRLGSLKHKIGGVTGARIDNAVDAAGVKVNVARFDVLPALKNGDS